jgi:acyl-CoA thioesterase II
VTASPTPTLAGAADAATDGFFGVRHGAERSTLHVVPHLTSGLGALFGGCALAAATAVLEHRTGRPVLWATAQFLAHATVGQTLELETRERARGANVTQAHLAARGPDGDVFDVVAALGRRRVDLTGTFGAAPAVLPPASCPRRPSRTPDRETIIDRLDLRSAVSVEDPDLPPGRLAPGRSAFWARVPGLPTTTAILALFGDLIPAGVSPALDAPAGGPSLDNSIRVHHVVPTDWYLVDIAVDGVANGVLHGAARLWADDGTLLATADQTVAVRVFGG